MRYVSLIASFIMISSTLLSAMDETRPCQQQLILPNTGLENIQKLLPDIKKALDTCNEKLTSWEKAYQKGSQDLEAAQSRCSQVCDELEELRNAVQTISSARINYVVKRDGASSLLFTLPLALWAYTDHRVDIVHAPEKEVSDNEKNGDKNQEKIRAQNALCDGIRHAAHRTAWALLCNSITPLVGVQAANGWGYILIYGYLEYLTQPLLMHKPTQENSSMVAYFANRPKTTWLFKTIAAYILSRLAL